MFGDLSKNFSRWEFACKCGCGFNEPDKRLVEALQILRDHPRVVQIDVNCGCRCLEYNRTIKGSKDTSQHILGTAADVQVSEYSEFSRRKKRIPPREVARMMAEIPAFKKSGIGVYKTFCHGDVRESKQPARWGLKWRKKK